MWTGIGPERRRIRLARVGHGLKRLVIVGSDGFISLAALQWLADQDASFAMLNPDGTVIATTGPVRPSESKLRRAQALAHSSGAAIRISRELIGRKLSGQEEVARNKLLDTRAADLIAHFRSELPSVVDTSHDNGKSRSGTSGAHQIKYEPARKRGLGLPMESLEVLSDANTLPRCSLYQRSRVVLED